MEEALSPTREQLRHDTYEPPHIDQQTNRRAWRKLSVFETLHNRGEIEYFHLRAACGNGSKGCVNPGHLKWATRAENEADKIDHGTSNRGERSGNAKLTNEEAVEIKRLLGVTKLSQKRIAQSFGVSATTVHEIASGKRWAWLSEGDFK